MNFFNKDGSIKKRKIKSVTGVRRGKRMITRFSQIKTAPAGKIGIRRRTRRGVALAIL